MSNIIPFEFESNNIRTVVDKDGSILFVAKDIAGALGYKNISDAIKDNCKGVARSYPLKTEGGIQNVRVILEPDVYRLIVKSKLPSAEKFERKVFEEILPTLRKTGSYSVKAPKTKGNKPQVFVTGGLLKELRLLTDSHGSLMRNAGIDDNHILIASSRVMESVLGINPAEIIDIPTPNNSQYYTATALGGQLPVKLSGREVNKRS